jgi:aryl-alcohol dehydrogenase-like predicted oxidoreductase
VTTLGDTGLEVSRLGLGLAALGRPGYINLGHAHDLAGHTEVEALQARAHEVLDAAYAAGIHYFDAARSYGRAEEFLGSWLRARSLGPALVTVGSKWGYTYTAEWRSDAEVNEVKDLSVQTLRRQERQSRELLGSTLALYQVHSATLESRVLDDHEVRDELARLRLDGVRIGFTTSGPRQRETIERALQVGGFDAVQATWNVLEPSAGPALAAARAAGLGVIVKEAAANGRLTARGAIPSLDELARSLGATPDALALAAALSQPWADVVLSGASTAAMLTSNLAALDLTLSPATLDRLSALAETPDEYWQTRAGLAWN